MASGITHHEADSTLLRYGRFHAVYAQDMIARRSARRRGGTVVDQFGTLWFEFVDRKVIVIDHRTGEVETIEVGSGDDHCGGDAALLRNFSDVVIHLDRSHSPLEAGLRSAAVCLAAAEACDVRKRPVVRF